MERHRAMRLETERLIVRLLESSHLCAIFANDLAY